MSDPQQPAEPRPADAQPPEPQPPEPQPPEPQSPEPQPPDAQPPDAQPADAQPAEDVPLTRQVLRKAASSPDELLEIMREEEKDKVRKAKRTGPETNTKPTQPGPVAPTPTRRPAPVASPAAGTSPAPTRGKPTEATARPGSKKPRGGERSIFASALTASGSGPVPQARPRSRPPRASAPSPSDTGVLPPLSPSGSGRVLGAGGPRIVVPRQPVWPVATAIGVVGVALVVAVVQVGHLLSGAVLQRPTAPTAAPPQPLSSPAPTGEALGGYQLAAIGAGRVVQTTDEGHLIVLRADPTSGELEVERAYELVNDPDRHLGDPGRRRWHGYYLDDLDVSRQLAVEAAVTDFERVVAAAVRLETGLEEVEAAALALAQVGGADRLLPALASDGADRVEALRKHGAAIGLGRAGYVGATPGLLDLLQQHQDSDRLRPLLLSILGRLSRLDLDPAEPGQAAERVRAWWGRQSPRDTFRRVHAR